MSLDDEPEACGDPEAFFLRDIPSRRPAFEYRFRSRGPRNVPRGTLLIFQLKGYMVADARLIDVLRRPAWTYHDLKYSGRLGLEPSTIRVFGVPVSTDSFMSVWPTKQPSQVWHILDPNGYALWCSLTSRHEPRRMAE